MLNVRANDWCSPANIHPWKCGECKEITAVWVLGVTQNKTIIDSLRLEIKLRDGKCSLTVTIKAQCTQEIRLGCSQKLRFLGMLLSLRLMEISSQLIKFSQSASPLSLYTTRMDDKSCVIVLKKNVLIGILCARSSFSSYFVSVSHIRVVVSSRWLPHRGACQ